MDNSKKCCCFRALRGPRGEMGAQGAPGEFQVNYLQVLDSSLFGIYTDVSNIQLTLNSANVLESGGFTVSTDEVVNDTINFPSTGVYQVKAKISYSFVPDDAVADTGDIYTLTIQAESNTIGTLGQIDLAETIGIPPAGGTTSIGGAESMNFFVNVTSLPFTLSFAITGFSFNFATDSELDIRLISVNIQQIDDTN